MERRLAGKGMFGKVGDLGKVLKQKAAEQLEKQQKAKKPPQRRQSAGVSDRVITHGARYDSSAYRWDKDTVHPDSYTVRVDIEDDHLRDGRNMARQVRWELTDGVGKKTSGTTSLPTRSLGGVNDGVQGHHPDDPGEDFRKQVDLDDVLGEGAGEIPIGTVNLRVENPGPYEVSLWPLFMDRGFTRRGTKLKAYGSITPTLICLMGDSIAAGQGLPDRFGDPASHEFISMTTSYYAKLPGFKSVSGKKPRWQESLSWRSERSGMTQAAFRQRSATRSVTFVSVASSGAGVTDGLLVQQKGRRHLAGSQVAELESLLAHRGKRRRPDVLMVSIGANDTAFSDALTDLAKNDDEDAWWHVLAWVPFLGFFLPAVSAAGDLFTSGRSQAEVQAAVEEELEKRLNDKLDLLAEQINDRIQPRVVLVTEYPVAMFDRNDRRPGPGCGLFDTPSLRSGISTQEATTIETAGLALNKVLRDWCERSDAGRGRYRFVAGIAAAFKGHGYCSSKPYWTGAEQSLRQQLDGDGVMHPNETGYKVIADIVAKALAEELRRPNERVPSRPA